MAVETALRASTWAGVRCIPVRIILEVWGISVPSGFWEALHMVLPIDIQSTFPSVHVNHFEKPVRSSDARRVGKS